MRIAYGLTLNAEERVKELLRGNKLYGAITVALDCNASPEVKTELLEKGIESGIIEVYREMDGKPAEIRNLHISTINVFLKMCLVSIETNPPKTPTYIVEPKCA